MDGYGEKIEKTEVDQSLKPPQQMLWAAIDAIIAALDKVSAANQAQKRADFDAALIELAQAHGKLAGVQTSSTQSYQQLTAQIIDTINQLVIE